MSRHRLVAFVWLVVVGTSACGNESKVRVDSEVAESTSSGPAVESESVESLAAIVGGGECVPIEGDVANGPSLVGHDWYEVSAADLVRLVGEGEHAVLSNYPESEIVVVSGTELRPLGAKQVPSEVAFISGSASGIASVLARLEGSETVVLGAVHLKPEWIAETVAVLGADGEVAFVGACALERQTPQFAAFADFVGQRPADLLLDIAEGLDVSESLNEFALEGVRPTLWEDRDPGERQFDLAETPVEVLEARSRVRLRVEIPQEWVSSDGLVLCTRVPMAWNQCSAIGPAFGSEVSLDAFVSKDGSETLEFWLFDGPMLWSTDNARSLGSAATTDLVDGRYVDVDLTALGSVAEIFAATDQGDHVAIELSIAEPFSPNG